MTRLQLIEWLLQDGAARDDRKDALVRLIVEDCEEEGRAQDARMLAKYGPQAARNLADAYRPEAP